MADVFYMKKEDADIRERLLFQESYYDKGNYMGGIRRFKGLRAHQAKCLIKNGFLDPEECQNCSPEAIDMIGFCEDMAKKYGLVFTLMGYAVSPEREDCRVNIDGLELMPNELVSNSKFTIESLIDFYEFNRHADELEATEESAYAWWD